MVRQHVQSAVAAARDAQEEDEDWEDDPFALDLDDEAFTMHELAEVLENLPPEELIPPGDDPAPEEPGAGSAKEAAKEPKTEPGPPAEGGPKAPTSTST